MIVVKCLVEGLVDWKFNTICSIVIEMLQCPKFNPTGRSLSQHHGENHPSVSEG